MSAIAASQQVQVALTGPLYLTIDQLAKAIPASRRTLDNWKKAGILPYVQIGRVIRYDLAEVRSALEQRFKVHPAKDKPYEVRPRVKPKAAKAIAAK
jgi:excisionase family DNA binding protein